MADDVFDWAVLGELEVVDDCAVALAGARAATTTAVESLLISAAELHIRADLGVDAAEKTLTTGPASTGPATAVTGPSAPGQTPPKTAAG